MDNIVYTHKMEYSLC